VFKTAKGFLNIKSIGLKVPEVDVNEDMPPDAPLEKRDKDSPENDIEEMLKEEAEEERASNELDRRDEIVATTKDIQIIRQTCVKAVGAMLNLSAVDKTTQDLIKIARRFEQYVLTGK